jgi:hypothetical protein
MGDLEYMPFTGHEVGVVIDVLAKDQTLANTICALARSTFLHIGYPERRSTGGNVALAFSPHDIPVGEVYRFGIYHLVETELLTELFPIEIEEVK